VARYTVSVPKLMRVILAVLLLAIPVAWLGLRAQPEEPSRPGTAQVRPGSVPSSVTQEEEAEEAPEEGEEALEFGAEEEDFLLAEELAGPGPCIELVVTAQGMPVANAQVAAARLEREGATYELTTLSAGPEGRRQAWCQPGEYLLVASAPGFAPKKLQLTVSAGSTPVARFELDAGHTLSGRVLDKDSEQPIAAAKLTIRALNDDFDSLMPEFDITSDAKGLFHVATLAAGTYEITAEAPGHTEKDMELAVPRPEGLSIELEGTSRLEGQVIDSTGAPVPGAEVWVLGQVRYSDSEDLERTDAQGRFSLEVNEGTYQLGASSGGQSGLHEGEVTVARGGMVDGLVIRLHPTGSLSGKVFVQASHEPLEGARVLILHAGSSRRHGARTDEKGEFREDQLVPGTYSVTVFRGGYPMTSREGVVVQAGQETPVEFALVRQATVKGSVTDALGRPAEEAYVLAIPATVLGGQAVRYTASVDETGRYELDELSPGSYRLEARLTLGSKPFTREITVQEGEEAHADFVIPEAMGRVEGSVLRASGGPPLHPVNVAAALSDSDTIGADVDETGNFTVSLLPGTYTLTAMYSDAQEPGPEVPVTVEAGKVSRVSLTVPDEITETSGVVLNARGEPVPDASVSLDDGEDLYSSTSADSRGRFTLRTGLSSVGMTASIRAAHGPEEGEVQNVRVGSQNVVVRLRKAGALRGRVIAARGSPVQSFELRVDRKENGAAPMDGMQARPFTGDTFEIVDLPVGALELRAVTSDGRCGKTTARIAPGQTSNVEIAVGVLGSVTGRLVDTSSGTPIALWVNADPGTPGEQMVYTGQEGRFRFYALEPGAHVLDIGSQGRIPFQLREGETLELGNVDPATVSKAP
jgi:hypothetical protein